MRRFLLPAGVSALVLWAAACGEDQRGDVTAPEPRFDVQEGAQSFTELAESGADIQAAPSDATAQAEGATIQVAHLTFFSDRNAFNARCPVLPLENFENVNVGGVCAGGASLSSATNDACYSPGAVLPGFTLTPVGSGGYVAISPPAFGVPSVVVGPDFFADNTDVTFSPAVTGAGVDLVDVFGGSTWKIEVFSASGSEGSTTSAAGFVGVFSAVPITRIAVTPIAGTAAELFDDLAFGICNQAPDCSAAAASPDALWPPNHQFAAIDVLGVTDPDGDPVTITVDGIWQDEPTDTYGDGRFTPDGQGVGTSTAEVRAERAGTKKVPGNGRVYHIFFTATDPFGASCSSTVRVGVPHDQGGDPPVDDGPNYDSTIP